MAWKASWAHRTGENEEKKNFEDNDKIKNRAKRRAPVDRRGLQRPRTSPFFEV